MGIPGGNRHGRVGCYLLKWASEGWVLGKYWRAKKQDSHKLGEIPESQPLLLASMDSLSHFVFPSILS